MDGSLAQTQDRVLVVEDDASTRGALERSLRRLGYDVLLAANGAAGLELAVDETPAVIITDIHMPQMDGHTLLRRLAHRDLDAAVIVTSGSGTMEDVVDVLRAGAVDYLKKPWTSSELVAAVGRAAEIHGKRRSQRGQAAVAPVLATAPARPDGPDRTFTRVLARLREGEIPLPAAPVVAAELRALVHRPGAQVEDVAALIERDPHLCTRVLRIANSALYARLGRSHDLRVAVARIGFRQIQNLVETIFLHGCYQVSEPRFAALLAKLWRASLARALAMRALADVATADDEINSETAYLVGLLADVGASFLLWLTAQRSSSGVAGSLDPERYLPSIRDKHEQVGETLLAGWGLDPMVALVAGAHHAGSPPAPPSSYWALSVLASQLVDRLAPGDDITRELPADARLVDRCAAELGIGRATLDQVVVPLAQELATLLEKLS